MLRLLFRTDAGHETGMGHLARCLVLAREAKLKGIEVRFALYGDNEAMELVLAEEFSCVLRSPVAISRQASEVCELVARDEVAILDFVHVVTLAQCADVPTLLKEWRDSAAATVLLDGGGKQGLAAICKTLGVDILLVPYAGSEGTSAGGAAHTLAGAEFAILPTTFQNQGSRRCRPQADRILVTCGGSDFKGVTDKILKALELIENKLEIRVIVGPMFHSDLVTKLDLYKRQSHHNVNLVHSPPSLAMHMVWCDVAVATSGLTKYELAATGTPAVLLSIDKAHEEANIGFLGKKTVRCLGIVDNVDIKKLSKAIIGLLIDDSLRSVMARNGQELIDGKGAERIIKNIVNLRA